MTKYHLGVQGCRVISSVGFIGLGAMGSRMARNLTKKMDRVHVFDVNKSATKALEKEGAVSASQVDNLSSLECVVSMLPSGQEVIDVYNGEDGNGLLSKMAKYSLVIDCSTTDPEVPKQLSLTAAKRDILFVDAPVSGGIIAAGSGDLTFMVGGTNEGLERSEPILRSMGRNIIHCGPTGSGQVSKICNNMLLAVSMIATAEAMHLGISLGLDSKILAKVINSSSGRCWSSEKYNPVPGVTNDVPANHGYQEGFASRLIEKDLKIAHSLASRTGTCTLLGDHALDIYKTVCQEHGAEMDFSVIYQYIKTMQRKR